MDTILDLPAEATAVGVVIIAIVAGLLIHAVGYAIARRIAERTQTPRDEFIIEHTRNPVRLLIVVGAVFVALVLVSDDVAVRGYILQVTVFVAVIATGWLLVGLTLVGYDLAMARYPVDVEENLEARTIATQLSVVQRFGAIIIWLLAIALALLTIPGVQPLAASMLAGAGVLGIVLGVAAGPLIGNLIAGVQIAFTQPIRLDDVVVIDGEWGRIEEITAAYVVVSIWDKRRLIVPLSQIVNSPVENWTRSTADILGTVSIHTDYRAPVDAIRAELTRILEASGKWDGVAASVLVTDASETTMKVRALMSAPDSGTAWDLRCLVREKLIEFLQREHPEALPATRELQGRLDPLEGG